MIQRDVYNLKAGNIDRLKISSEKLSLPSSDEVQINLYSATPDGSFIPGLEYAGEVLAVGQHVTSYQIGDRVMGVTRFGAYATHLNIDHRYLVALPKSWSYSEGAGYLVQVLTAYYGLSNLGALRAGHNVLIHSAAGGVGIWANRICKSIGAKTIGTVGSANKLELLEKEGYQSGIVRNTKTFKKDLINALNGAPLDLIMECIGGKIMKIGFELLGPMGRQIVYGSAHYGGSGSRPNYFKLIPKYLMRPKLDPQNMIKQNKGVLAFNLIYLFDNVSVMDELLKELQPLQLGKPIIGHTFQFHQLPEAIRLFQGGSTMGKVVVEV